MNKFEHFWGQGGPQVNKFEQVVTWDPHCLLPMSWYLCDKTLVYDTRSCKFEFATDFCRGIQRKSFRENSNMKRSMYQNRILRC